MERLTDKSYWNDMYGDHRERTSLSIEGYKNKNIETIYNSMIAEGLDGKSILEIGAGGSQWLIFLAQHHPTSKFTGLDYTMAGCQELDKRASDANVDIDVICADLFNPPTELFGQYDLIISYGVVEHFDSLSHVMGALSQYSKPTGTIWTIIPNMSGIAGSITKYLNKSVYEIHNPHNLEGFVEGHRDAQLEVVSANYLCTSEFGVLSSCINEKSPWLHRSIYLWLSRLSKLIALFEEKGAKLPTSKLLSPYIVCTSKIFSQS